MRQIFSILIFFFAHVAVFAQSPAKFEKLTNTSGVQLFYPTGTAPAGAGQLIWDKAVDTDGGQPKVGGSGTVRNPSGGSVPVNGSTRVPGAGVSGAIGRAIPKILGRLAGPLAVGIELYDLGKELGFTLGKDAAGKLTVEKVNSNVCSVAPCYAYTVGDYNGNQTSPATSTPGASCPLAYPSFPAGLNPVATLEGTTNATYVCHFRDGSGGNLFSRAVQYTSVPAVPASNIPSTYQEFVNAIAAKSGWPSGSKVAPVLRDSLELEPAPAIESGPITVTGPASSPGLSSTTVNTTNNTTTTSNTTHNHTYQGNTVTTTTVTNNTTINNTTGDTISNETTNTSSPVPAPEETCGLPGKPACKIDETGTPPDPGLKPAAKITEIMKPLDDFVASPVSKLPALPALNWSFALPTGCTAIALPAFAPFLQDIDICPFLPMFHDVMSIVWILGGLFGAIGTFWRNVFSQN